VCTRLAWGTLSPWRYLEASFLSLDSSNLTEIPDLPSVENSREILKGFYVFLFIACDQQESLYNILHAIYYSDHINITIIILYCVFIYIYMNKYIVLYYFSTISTSWHIHSNMIQLSAFKISQEHRGSVRRGSGEVKLGWKRRYLGSYHGSI
jgi:hypothetical protein